MPIVSLSAQQIHILIQALRIAVEDGSIDAYAKPREIEQLRAALQNVKG